MRVRFWGVRGSIACPGPETIRYGGNTPCIEVRCGERVIIFDGGTGLRALGNALVKDPTVREYDIFLTHCHLDHVIGLPFFAPFFAEGYRIRIWAGNLLPADNIEQVMRRLMSSPLFPVEVEIFKSAIEFHDFQFRRYTSSLRRRDAADRAARSSGRCQRLSSRVRRTRVFGDQRHRRLSGQARQGASVARARGRFDRL